MNADIEDKQRELNQFAEESMTTEAKLIKSNLQSILKEIGKQSSVGEVFPPEQQSFSEQIEQIREWIEDAGEFGIAYEVIVALLEAFPFQVSGEAAVQLLEVGLLMRFKTDDPKDARFDSR